MKKEIRLILMTYIYRVLEFMKMVKRIRIIYIQIMSTRNTHAAYIGMQGCAMKTASR